MKSSKILIIALSGILLTILAILYRTKWVGHESTEPKVSSELWVLAIDEVDKVWRGNFPLADPLIKKNCPQFYKEKDEIPSELKSCRRELLQCYFDGRSISLKNKKQFHKLSISFDEINKRSDELPLVARLNLNGKALDLELNDTCRQVELPQGAYWGNANSESKERLWHTSGIRYFVDRILVRKIDIREWLLTRTDISEKDYFKRLKKIYLEDSSIDYFRPSDDLYPVEMEDYCTSRRSEVLSSQVRAALTFHHGRSSVEDIFNQPPSSNSAPHPFGVRKQDSPQFLAEKTKLKASAETCRKIYSSECKEYSYYSLFPTGMGWSGISELLGGPAEYVINKKFPRKNLHPSSYYHPLDSKVHEAGKRVYWTGKGHRRVDFNFFTLPFFENREDLFDVGFRCMRVMLDE